MSMFRMAGAAGPNEGTLATDEDFDAAIRAHFGSSGAEDSTPPIDPPSDPTPDVEGQSGEGDDGPSPLPDSPSPGPSETGTGAGIVADGGFEDTPADLLSTPEPEPSPEPTPEPEPLPVESPDLDLNELFERYYGVRPTAPQMTALLSFVDQVQRLTPDQQAAVNAIMSGQIPPATPATSPVAPAQSPYAQPSSYSQPPAPQSASSLPDFADLTPEARAYLEPLYRQQAEITSRLAAQEEQTARRQLEAQQQTIVAGIQHASNQFVAEYGSVLTPADLVLLETRAQQSGQFPAYMASTGNDSARAYRGLLDMLSYSDPAIRDKITSLSPAPATPAGDTPEDLTRKSKASSVAAGGQAGRKVSPLGQSTESIPTDPEGARQWAINEISRTTGMPRVS